MRTKRIFALLVAAVLTVSMGMAAYAAQETTEEMSPSSYGTLTYWQTDSMREHRDDTGYIYLGYAIEDGAYNAAESNWADPGSASITLDAEVEGEGFTAVYADNSALDITGSLKLTDDASGEHANDFNGVGAAIVASSDSVLELNGLDVETHGFMRDSLIVEEGSVVYVNVSCLATYGNDPLTNAYDGYRNSANQDRMTSPPWVLGIQGGGRTVNLLSDTPTLVVKDSELVSGGWAVLSVDDCSAGRIYVFDSLIKVASEAEGGMDDGGDLFGFERDYGSGYGSYYIGNPTEYFYGAHFDGETYAGILTGAELGYYGSSATAVDIVTGDGTILESGYVGKGEPTVIDTVFGWMAHGSGTIVAAEGTQINTACAAFLSKASGVDFTVSGEDTSVSSGTGILYQMIDNDDRTVGNYADDEWGMTNFNDRLVEDSGLPSQTSSGNGGGSGEISASGEASGGASSGEMGGNFVTVTDGASITGDIYNGTGYYGQSAGKLTVTISGGASLSGAIALTETIHGAKATPAALAALKEKYTNIEYELMDADWNITENEEDAAYIHFTTFTMNEYFCLGQVLNHVYYNGESTLDVIVEAGSTWNVTAPSLITSLSGEGTVNGTVTDNGDGTLTVMPLQASSRLVFHDQQIGDICAAMKQNGAGTAAVFGGTLGDASDEPVIHAEADAEITLVGVDCQTNPAGNSIETAEGSGANLIVNMWDTRMVGNITAAAGTSITLNLYNGGMIAGDVFGDGEVILNIYEGGDFHDFGGYPRTDMGSGPAAPTFEDTVG